MFSWPLRRPPAPESCDDYGRKGGRQDGQRTQGACFHSLRVAASVTAAPPESQLTLLPPCPRVPAAPPVDTQQLRGE